uniref:DNA-directed RNA polymerase II subunit GRINL1A-like n=1 Tax=Jaculus jaculus TaxID=51337 RepID=UPI001E1B0E08|nr:DNA-directed RNA polymerase II subunit GRINL1A-like [Jaculus jaculus]
MCSLPRGFEPRAPEDLGQRSLAELREMWRRQERLLRNEKFICKLPDKGKKIADTVAKLKAAIAEREELRGRSELFDPVSLDCKLRHKAIARVDVDIEKAQNSDQIFDTSSLVPGCSSVDNITSSKTTSETQGLAQPAHTGSAEAVEAEHTVNTCPASERTAREPSSSAASQRLSQHCTSSQAEDSAHSFDSLFIDKLQRITLSDQSEHHSEENTSAENLKGHFPGTPKKPHFMEVIETRARNPVPPTHKFKTNVLPAPPRDSPGQPPRGLAPVSEERRRHERQHLDDVTAARLRPLHHEPARLLAMEESLALQRRQQRNYEEIQAKLAAQKLAERLDFKMQSYNPEGGSSGQYREVRDEDDAESSEEF